MLNILEVLKEEEDPSRRARITRLYGDKRAK